MGSTPLLTSDSCAICQLAGGRISVALCPPTYRAFFQGAAPQVTLPSRGAGEPAGGKGAQGSGGGQAAPAPRESVADGAQPGNDAPQDASASRPPADSATDPSAAAPQKEPDWNTGLIWKCEKCAKKECPHRISDPSALNSELLTSTGELERNYNAWSGRLSLDHKSAANSGHPAVRAHDEALAGNAEYEREKRAEKSWTWARHHAICVNQGVNAIPKLAQLCRAFKYDINAAQNCVILSMPDKKVASSSREDPFGAMAWSRLQWHPAHHRYPIPAAHLENMRKNIGIFIHDERKTLYGRNLRCYADLLRERLEEIASRYDPANRPRGVCPAPGEHGDRDGFVKAMDDLAEEIRKYLAGFCEQAHHSFPWYVSAEAYRFAFALPRAVKLVTVRKVGETSGQPQVELEKFRATRFGDTKKERGRSMAFEPQGKLPRFTAATPADEARIDFCANIDHFVILDEIPEIDLGKQPENIRHFPPPEQAGGAARMDAKARLEASQADILRWLYETTGSEK